MQLVEVHVIGAEPAQAAVDRRPHVFRAAVPAGPWRTAAGVGHLDGVGEQADLGGQHRTLAVAAGQRPADQFLVGVRPVGVGGVDQRHAEVERLVDDGDRDGVVTRGFHVIGEGHPHAAQADDADLGAGAAERGGPHACCPPGVGRPGPAGA